MATKSENMMQEVVLKFAFYDTLKCKNRCLPEQSFGNLRDIIQHSTILEMFLSVIRNADDSMINKKNVAIVLAVGLILSIGCVVGQQHVLQAENCTFLNLTKFAAENPVYPELGYLSKQAVLGENASINLAQFTTGSHSGAQYHSASDEIDFIIQGQANLKAKGEVRPVKSGDLIYLPSGTVHDYEALGTEDLQILVVFSPPLDENDRHLV